MRFVAGFAAAILVRMKVTAMLAVSCLMGAAAMNASAGGEALSFRFDNGDGLYGTAVHSTFSSRHGAFLPENGTPVSRYFVHQELGAGTLHYGSIVSEDERHYYGGVSVGNVTAAYFQGDGEQLSRAPNTLYEDLNQYFFHGGSRLPFELRGVAADVGLPGAVSARFAATEVAAPGVQDRGGWYAGLAGSRFEAGLFRFERGDEPVGRGINLGVRAGGLDLAYQAVRSEYDARMQRLALGLDVARSVRLSLEVERVSNDLFARDDEQRVMLRFRKELGSVPVLHAAGDDDPDGGEKTGQPRFNKAVGIGIGLGIGAIALSSGSSDNDSARRFAGRNNAAFDVMNRINPVSVRQNREHGGWVYRNADNTYGYTEPVAGQVASVDLGLPETRIPKGTRASASYHTHGGPDPRFDNENFSLVDLEADRRQQVDGYLGTPAGFLKLHNFETSSIRVLGRIAN